MGGCQGFECMGLCPVMGTGGGDGAVSHPARAADAMNLYLENQRARVSPCAWDLQGLKSPLRCLPPSTLPLRSGPEHSQPLWNVSLDILIRLLSLWATHPSLLATEMHPSQFRCVLCHMPKERCL